MTSVDELNSPMKVELLTTLTDGWQAISSGINPVAVETEEEKSARLQSEAALLDELSLILGSEHLVVLAGLGTSLGIPSQINQTAPTMSDLWDKLSQLPSFAKVRSILGKAAVDSKNFEHVLSDAQARLSLDQENETLRMFIQEAETVVLEQCSFISETSNVSLHEVFLRKVARRSTRLQRTQIFTTNYDLAFEEAARKARFNVVDGFVNGDGDFDGASFDLDFVRRRPNEELALEPNVFHLLKLHGSVDWDGAGDSVRKASKPESPLLIYPSTAKYRLSFKQPYLEFMSRFQIALRQPNVGVVIVGFGFNDDHIVAPIEAAIRGNIGLRMIVVTPGAHDDIGRPKSIDWIEELIGLGDRRLTLLRGTFDDLVRMLPDVPSQEERDAHADRISGRSRKGLR